MDIETVDRFSRVRILLQKEGVQKLHYSSVLIMGVGGVGGFALDCLYRTGIGNITIIDKDVFEITNQNRQLGSNALGEPKVFALEALYPGIKPLYRSVDETLLNTLNINDYDVILDCVDSIDAKVAIAHWGHTKLLSSMGSAKRLNPLNIQTASIWKTYNDHFARKFRNALKKTKFRGNFKVVFSTEEPQCKGLGSFEAVTGSFGLQLASETIRKILHKN